MMGKTVFQGKTVLAKIVFAS